MSDLRYEATGQSRVWAGLTFDQYKVTNGTMRVSHFIFRLHGRDDVTIESARVGYRATIAGQKLPTKFREWETAARAIKKALEQSP